MEIFLKWGRWKRETNGKYVNCKEMRFVIRNLIDVDNVSPETVLEIPFDVAWTMSVFPQRGRDDAAQLR